MTQLGRRQRACLRALAAQPDGVWFLTGREPLWGTRSNTALALGSLVKHGLVENPRYGVFVITTAGKRLAVSPGDIPRIHPELIEMYDKLHRQAVEATFETYEGAPIEKLLEGRHENSQLAPGHMGPGQRAWLDGIKAALDALIETRTMGEERA